MKKNLFYPAVHITDVMEKLGRSIDDSDHYYFPLHELDESVGEHYVERALSGAVDAVVHRRVSDPLPRFEWNATGKYAPDIRFSVLSTSGLTMDENGSLSSPILYDCADLILPFLDFNFKGNTAEALVAWGFYERTDIHGVQLEDMNNPSITDGQKYLWRTGGGGQTEIVHNFCQRSIYKTANILVAVPWGGAHSDTRGQDEETLEKLGHFERGLEFFQHCASPKQGEGYDFYIIDIAKAVAEDAMTDFRVMLARSENRALCQQEAIRVAFHEKYIAFQARQKEFTEFKEKVADIERRINARYMEEIKSSALAVKSCIILPEKVGSVYDYLELPKQPADLTCTLEELEQARIPIGTWDQLKVAEDALHVKMNAWLDFAPRYADLAEIVLQKCHGAAEVHLTCFKITMPNTFLEDPTISSYVHRNRPTKSAYATREYAFSEVHLEGCTKHVQEFLDEAQDKREGTLQSIRELVTKLL